MYRVSIALGGLAGCTGVTMAAWAAHGLPARLPPAAVESVRSAVLIHLVHALALLCCGLWAERTAAPLAKVAAGCFALGTALFCGAVYALALGGVRVPMLAPAGGLVLMLAWLLLAASAFA